MSLKLVHVEFIVQVLDNDDGDDGYNHAKLIKDIREILDWNINFLYRMGERAYLCSFGISFTRLERFPEEVLQITKERSRAFQKEL